MISDFSLRGEAGRDEAPLFSLIIWTDLLEVDCCAMICFREITGPRAALLDSWTDVVGGPFAETDYAGSAVPLSCLHLTFRLVTIANLSRSTEK